MICLSVLLQVKPGSEAEAASLFRVLQEESRKEPGCLFYKVYQRKDSPGLFLVHEEYVDEGGLKAHHNTSHFKKYAAEGVYQLVESREADLYEPI